MVESITDNCCWQLIHWRDRSPKRSSACWKRRTQCAAELLTMIWEVCRLLSQLSDKSPDKTVPEQSGLSSGGGPDSSRGSGCPDSPDGSGVQLFTHWSLPKLVCLGQMLGIVRAAGLSRSVEVTILKEAVFKRETLLLSLTPLLVVKVDVGALKR